MEFQDTRKIELGAFTTEAEEIFHIIPHQIRPYEHFNNVHFSIAYEFDLNQYVISREVYNTLDWLGDVGGLKEALNVIGVVLLGLINFKSYDNFMVSKMYRVQTETKKKPERKKKSLLEARIKSALKARVELEVEGKLLETYRLQPCWELLHSFLPKCCFFFRRRRPFRR